MNLPPLRLPDSELSEMLLFVAAEKTQWLKFGYGRIIPTIFEFTGDFVPVFHSIVNSSIEWLDERFARDHSIH